MRSIVTGGNGFIGGHIVDSLVLYGHEVIVIDNLSSTFHEKFYYNDKAAYVEANITDKNLSTLFKGADYVFHLAAESRIQPTLEDPVLACNTNYLGTARVLQSAVEQNVKRVMFSSTSAAYGLQPAPHHESLCSDPLNPYSLTKVAAEELCKMYHKLFGLEVVVFRYFNVYGPREPVRGQYAPVVGRFLRQKEAGEALTIVQPGSQTRDFIHVDDIVRANLAGMSAPRIHCDGEIYNVGSGVNISILELAQKISDNLEWLEPREGEAEHTLAHLHRIKEHLNWEPLENLDNYLDIELTRQQKTC